MPRALHTPGEYPPDWPEINAAVCVSVGHRCIRCGHPYVKGTHGTGEWSPCDQHCTHRDGATRVLDLGRGQKLTEAAWRILTVHHFDGNKANCSWWNLLALCQRCHLRIQGHVNPQQPYMLEHAEWMKPLRRRVLREEIRGPRDHARGSRRTHDRTFGLRTHHPMKTSLRMNRQPRHQLAKLGLLGKKGGRMRPVRKPRGEPPELKWGHLLP